MTENYFYLPRDIQRNLIQEAASQLSISEIAIEKDIWVCWILKQIFELGLKMVFKGGTSLSKAYKLINRFSEDIDITIDYRNFKDVIDIGNTSRNQLDKIIKKLQINLADCIQETILPFLYEKASTLPDQIKVNIEFDKETLRFYYPSVLFDFYTDAHGNYYVDANGSRYSASGPESIYLRDHVLIEFGVKNSAEPHEKHTIKTLLSEIQFKKNVTLPEAQVDVQPVLKTFWEKATLIHAECY